MLCCDLQCIEGHFGLFVIPLYFLTVGEEYPVMNHRTNATVVVKRVA